MSAPCPLCQGYGTHAMLVQDGDTYRHNPAATCMWCRGTGADPSTRGDSDATPQAQEQD